MEYDLIKDLYARMAGGVYLEKIEGTCQINVVDEKGSVYVWIGYYNNELTYAEAEEKAPDAKLSLRRETLQHILSNPEFDLRDGNILKQVEVEGDLLLIGFLFSLIKRPTPEIQQLIQETERKAASFKPRVSEIKRVHRPSKDELVRMIADSVPFVVTGVLDDWELLAMSLEEIKGEYGDVKLRPDLKRGPEKYETLMEFIDKMEDTQNTNVYTGGCRLPLAMWARFQWPFFEWDALIEPQIWLGTKSGDKPCTDLHRDCINGMLANIFGRKKLILFAPDETEYLYANRAFNTFQKCDVKDVQHVDLEKFPLFKKAVPLEVTIGPGELLVIPAFWYHCVYAVDNVFSISAGISWRTWEVLKPVRAMA